MRETEWYEVKEKSEKRQKKNIKLKVKHIYLF